MQHSRLIEIFSTLEKQEQRELGKFVRSPVFNQREDVTALYDFLYQHSPFKKVGILHREHVFQAIFPNEMFDQTKLDYTMSFLFSVIKSYLVFKEQEADPAWNGVLLARALRHRNLGRLFEKELKFSEKLLDNQPFRDAAYHFNSFNLHLEKHTFSKQESRTSTASFQEFSEELTRYFLAKKLWEGCTVATHKAVSKVDFDDGGLLDRLLAHIEENDYSETPAVNLYYHCYKALTAADNLHWFEALRALIRRYHGILPPAEVKDLYLVAINYCIRRFNTGEKAFVKEAFQLYKEGLELGAFLENNLLSRFTYNNIVMAGLVLKEFDWVEKFLYDFKDNIEPKYRDSTFNYNLAIYYFQKPDQEKAMMLLQQADFDDVMHNLNARKMMLQIFLERDEREVLSSWLTSFKSFIYRHRELGSYQKDRYLHLIKFTARLLQIPISDKGALAALRAEIEATEQVAEKAWLLERVM